MSAQLTPPVDNTIVSPAQLFVANTRLGWVSPESAARAIRMLSRREREVLALLEARWTDREIAEALCISYRTATTHVSNIFDKLGINSRREAAAFAVLASRVLS